MGHDWGGAISWTFSALHPGLLDNLVICNCPHMAAIRWELGQDDISYFRIELQTIHRF